jgi:hypothetical protein
VLRELKEVKVSKVLGVFLETQEHKVHKEVKVSKELQEPLQVHKVQQDNKDFKVSWEHLVCRVEQEHKDHKVIEDHKVYKDLQVLQGFKVLKVHGDHRVL